MGWLFRNGMKQIDLVNLLTTINTNYIATLTLLDADLGVAATDYVTGQAIAFPSTEINVNGITSQGSLLSYLNTFIANFGNVNAKLDADALTDSNYAALLDITDNITLYGKDGNMSPMGLRQGDLINLLQTIITNINALNAKLVADATVQTATYADNDVTDTVDAVS